MNLVHLLSEKKSLLLTMWFDAVLSTYPQDTSNFLRKNENRFANPVGHTLQEGFGLILDSLIEGRDAGSAAAAMDDIIRVRAVQDFSPSQAVAFIFTLKTVIRDLLSKEKAVDLKPEDLGSIEEKIDSYGLAAFDIYMQCREKLYDIKANEVKNMTYRILQRAQKMGLDSSDAAAPSDEIVNKKQEEVTK